jgi:hypothetical protein
MNWYISKLVFQILNKSETHQFDEQLRLIQAMNENEAIEKALKIGKAEEDEFVNSENQKVHLKFQAITSLHAVKNLENGTELCSQLLEKRTEENYLESIKLKHQKIIASLTAVSN